MRPRARAPLLTRAPPAPRSCPPSRRQCLLRRRRAQLQPSRRSQGSRWHPTPQSPRKRRARPFRPHRAKPFWRRRPRRRARRRRRGCRRGRQASPGSTRFGGPAVRVAIRIGRGGAPPGRGSRPGTMHARAGGPRRAVTARPALGTVDPGTVDRVMAATRRASRTSGMIGASAGRARRSAGRTGRSGLSGIRPRLPPRPASTPIRPSRPSARSRPPWRSRARNEDRSRGQPHPFLPESDLSNIEVGVRPRMTDRPNAPQQRLDRWLWFARILKSRTLAAELVGRGKVRVNRVRVVKPSHLLREGDVLTIALRGEVRVVQVLAIGERRGPPHEASQLYRPMEDASGPPQDGGPVGIAPRPSKARQA